MVLPDPGTPVIRILGIALFSIYIWWNYNDKIKLILILIIVNVDIIF